MTLLRRAPREVYRVYGEQEFLEGADHAEALPPLARACEDRRANARSAAPGGGGRHLRRVTGTALLVGAVGAVGAVTAASGLLSGRGPGRRIGESRRASLGPLVASHVSRAPIWRARAPRTLRSALRPASQPMRTGQGLAVVRRRGLARGGRRPGVEIAVERPQHPPAVQASVAGLTATAGAPAGAQRPMHPEFGFER
jgi:hypothetical protein